MNCLLEPFFSFVTLFYSDHFFIAINMQQKRLHIGCLFSWKISPQFLLFQHNFAIRIVLKKRDPMKIELHVFP